MAISDQITAINNAKQAIKASIEAKGITVGTAPLANYSSKIDAIPVAAAATLPAAWTRPSDWLTFTAPTSTDQKFIGLHAIFPDSNFVALKAAGAYTVNWGDGLTENFASGVVAYHTYDYNNAAFNGTLTTRGYKQAVITVTPQAGETLTLLDLQQKHNTAGLQAYTTGFLDIAIAGPSLSSLFIGTDANGAANYNPTQVVKQSLLEQINIVTCSITSALGLFSSCSGLQNLLAFNGTSACNEFGYAFRNCTSLRTVPLFDTSAAIGFFYVFQNCYSLTKLPSFNLANVDDMGGAFYGCTSLESAPTFNMPNVLYLYETFYNCYSLKNVPALNTSKVTSFQNLFGNCYSLTNPPLLDSANVTDFSYMFYNCKSLRTVPLYNTAKATTMYYMFGSCTSLATVPTFSTVSLTNAANMFAACSSLVSVPWMDFSKVTNASYTFTNCTSLKTVPAFNLSASTTCQGMFQSAWSLTTIPAFTMPTGACNFQAFLNGCTSLSTIPAISFNTAGAQTSFNNVFDACSSLVKVEATGLKWNHSFANAKLSADRLNDIYTNLPVVTSKTITVTGNYGTTSDNPAIATAKGWTVTG